MQAAHQPQPRRERRNEPRLPEELLAVVNDNAAVEGVRSAVSPKRKRRSA